MIFKKCRHLIVVVQSQSHVPLFAIPWTITQQVPLSSSISCSLHKFMSIESVMLSNKSILCCPLLLLRSIFPASGSFPMSWLFATGGQRTGDSALALVLPMNIQDWFPLGLISFLSKKVFPSTIQKRQFFSAQPSLW